MKEFLIDNIKKRSYNFKTDRAGNILAFKKSPKLALQSHYDMVCVGNAPVIEIIEKNGWMMAKNSSLGADNGMGVAIMLALMEEYDNLEFLFTNDEEIGLIGAFNLELDINSPYLLNLDSEDEFIYIGCAGGVDAEIVYPLKKNVKKGFKAKAQISSLPGGHSGVDIDKNIPNAIKELAKNLKEVCFFKGGERRNSIPASAEAEIFYQSPYGTETEVFEEGYVDFINSLVHGVLEWDLSFKVVSKSVNLALVENQNVVLSLRANSNEKLEELKDFIKLKCSGSKIKFTSQYPAWKPEISKLSSLIKEISGMQYRVIHAGLECAVLKNRFKNVQMASIGPVIQNPHSVNERVDLSSVAKVYSLLHRLVKSL